MQKILRNFRGFVPIFLCTEKNSIGMAVSAGYKKFWPQTDSSSVGPFGYLTLSDDVAMYLYHTDDEAAIVFVYQGEKKLHFSIYMLNGIEVLLHSDEVESPEDALLQAKEVLYRNRRIITQEKNFDADWYRNELIEHIKEFMTKIMPNRNKVFKTF